MSTTAKHRGHDIWFDEDIQRWRYADDGRVVTFALKVGCRHCGLDPVSVRAKVPADLRGGGEICEPKWRRFLIDACIAGIVTALQEADIDMRSSCCGHGEGPGEILLQDGRRLVIEPAGGTP